MNNNLVPLDVGSAVQAAQQGPRVIPVVGLGRASSSYTQRYIKGPFPLCLNEQLIIFCKQKSFSFYTQLVDSPRDDLVLLPQQHHRIAHVVSSRVGGVEGPPFTRAVESRRA